MKTSENSAKFQPIDRDGLVERVANLLSDAIIKGQMKPGDRLSESVIAREMGLSRAPVREAARLLESSGLVAYQPNRGFFVRKISAQQLDDLYDLRIAIEVAAARRVLRNGDDTLLDGLREQYETLKAVANTDTDMHVQVEADMEFHRRMILASGNPRFLKIFDQIARETELSIVVIGTPYGDPEWIAETHVPILEALAARDEPGVVAAIEYHIGEAQRLVTQQFRHLEDK